MKAINYIEAEVPTWAMAYIFFNDALDITDDQQNQINRWLNKTTKWLELACPNTIVRIHESGPDEYYSRRWPAFGPRGKVCKIALVAWANNNDERGQMLLPWEDLTRSKSQ
jgi:hypothetical protein